MKVIQILKTNWKYLLVIVIALLLILKSISYSKLSDKYNEKTHLITTMGDSLQVWKDKNNVSHAKIEVLQTQSAKDFLTLSTKDKEIQNLQSTVKEYKNKLGEHGSVTNISTEVKFDTIYASRDTTFKDISIQDSIKNSWIKTSFGFIEGKTFYKLQTRDDYSIIIGEESQGLFKSKKPFVEVLNKNPYSETKSVKTYQVIDRRKKRFGLGVGIGYGVGTNFQFQPYIGISFNYLLISF